MNEIGLLLLKAYGLAVLVYGLSCVGFLFSNYLFKTKQPLKIYAFLLAEKPITNKIGLFLLNSLYLSCLGLGIYYLKKNIL